jgi:trk system potassium uptake protein TrkH
MPLYYNLWKRRWRIFFGDPEMHALWIIAVLTALLVGYSLHESSHGNWKNSMTSALLTAFSAQSTSGFAIVSIATLDPPAKLGLIFSMFIGGGAGSTAGGIKLLRLLILLRLIHWWVQRSRLSPHAQSPVRFSGRTWSSAQLVDLLLIVFLYVVTIAASWLLFVLYGYNPLDALFEVVSATGTVGLSTGVTSAELPSVLKIVLAVDMLLGRLEFLALLVFISPHTWIGSRSETMQH